MGLVAILIYAIIIVILLWIARMIIATLGLPANIAMIIWAVLALIALLVILSAVGLLPAGLGAGL